ncbi:TIR domain-containing protein [Candidatus Palauibacter irciniicola]|uniref:TIR domain-containing protein n=1 Tax=Candidatus Palauibacter irciniicola TaxID=3056733 RepID=UPI003B027785
MNTVPRHTFVSFHNDDEKYRDVFVDMMSGDIVDKSVSDGDIDDERLATETIRQKIRDEFIRDATVTVVLVGACTWQRKHVDWEIGSGLRDTKLNSRCGLLGILLPTHPDFTRPSYRRGFLPPRLWDNCVGADAYASVYDWQRNSQNIRRWIHAAFQRRREVAPDNSRSHFRYNRSGPCSTGW